MASEDGLCQDAAPSEAMSGWRSRRGRVASPYEVVDLDLFVPGCVEVAVDLPAWPDSLETEAVALVDHRAMCRPHIPASAMRRHGDAACGQSRGDDPAQRRERSSDLDADFH